MTKSGMLNGVATGGQHLTARAIGRDLRRRSLMRVVAVAAAAAAIGAAAGYSLRAHSGTVTVRVGQAYSTPYQIVISTKQWSYAVPLHVRWRDSAGTWYEAGSRRPACLPPTGAIHNVTFGTVNVNGGGGPSYAQVVWVDCSATAAAP